MRRKNKNRLISNWLKSKPGFFIWIPSSVPQRWNISGFNYCIGGVSFVYTNHHRAMNVITMCHGWRYTRVMPLILAITRLVTLIAPSARLCLKKNVQMGNADRLSEWSIYIISTDSLQFENQLPWRKSAYGPGASNKAGKNVLFCHILLDINIVFFSSFRSGIQYSGGMLRNGNINIPVSVFRVWVLLFTTFIRHHGSDSSYAFPFFHNVCDLFDVRCWLCAW